MVKNTETQNRYFDKERKIFVTILDGMKGGIINQYTKNDSITAVLKTDQQVENFIAANTLSNQLMKDNGETI